MCKNKEFKEPRPGQDWPNLKFKIEGRKYIRGFHVANQNGICAYCGDAFSDTKTKQATLEHIVPQTYGGPDSINNTIAVCYRCNQDRDSFPLKFHQVVGILVARGFDGLPAVMGSYMLYLKIRLSVFTRHIQMFSIMNFG